MTNKENHWYYRKGELVSGPWDVRIDANKVPVQNWAHVPHSKG